MIHKDTLILILNSFLRMYFYQPAPTQSLEITETLQKTHIRTDTFTISINYINYKGYMII